MPKYLATLLVQGGGGPIGPPPLLLIPPLFDLKLCNKNILLEITKIGPIFLLMMFLHQKPVKSPKTGFNRKYFFLSLYIYIWITQSYTKCFFTYIKVKKATFLVRYAKEKFVRWPFCLVVKKYHLLVICELFRDFLKSCWLKSLNGR